MGRFINTDDLNYTIMKRKSEYGNLAWIVERIVKEMINDTFSADVIEKRKYDLLQKDCETLRHQLREYWDMRDKIDKSIKEMKEEYDNFKYSDNKTLGASFGIRKAIDILEKNLGEENE